MAREPTAHRGERSIDSLPPLTVYVIFKLGGVAQLGERLVRNQKVAGSIPVTSIFDL